MIAPTRALVVEDIDSWAFTIERAARRAGASEVVRCPSLPAVRDVLRRFRFDIAVLDIGLDPDNDLNADGIGALKAIREADGDSTRCVLVTGWQGGDRMALQSEAHLDHGVDFAFMKEKYDAPVVTAKLTELLAQAPERRRKQGTAMASLSAGIDGPWGLERWLLDALSPGPGGIQAVYKLVDRLLRDVTPAIAMHQNPPLEKGQDGICTGVYWSRALGCAIGVGLAPTDAWNGSAGVPAGLASRLRGEVVPDRITEAHEKDLAGRVWEMPGIERDQFPAK